MNLYLPRLTRKNIFDEQDHTTFVLRRPRLQGLRGNAMRVVMLLSPVLDQPALCIHSVCLNGLAAFLTDKTECVRALVCARVYLF